MYYLLLDKSSNHLNAYKRLFQTHWFDKSIVIASSEAGNLTPREEAEAIKSIEEGAQGGSGGESKRK